MIADYSDLQNAVGDFLNRQDLAQTCKTFIQFAENSLNRRLRTRDMLTGPVIVSFTTDTATLPVDFCELRGAPVSVDSGKPLAYKTPEELSMTLGDACLTGDPVEYTLLGDSMRIAPAPDPAATATTDVSIFYYARIPSLLEPTDTNWLLQKHADLYLYTSLVQSAPYLKDDERIAVWGGIAGQIIADIEMSEERGNFRGAAPRVNVRHAIG